MMFNVILDSMLGNLRIVLVVMFSNTIYSKKIINQYEVRLTELRQKMGFSTRRY